MDPGDKKALGGRWERRSGFQDWDAKDATPLLPVFANRRGRRAKSSGSLSVFGKRTAEERFLLLRSGRILAAP